MGQFSVVLSFLYNVLCLAVHTMYQTERCVNVGVIGKPFRLEPLQYDGRLFKRSTVKTLGQAR